jgi:hypothetical protein
MKMTDNNVKPSTWHNQDVLKLSVEQWVKALKDPAIFNEEAKRLVRFVYELPEHRSTVSDISANFKVHPNVIKSDNRKIARALYHKYNTKPPKDSSGQKRYWNIVFDCDPNSPKDSKRHFFWILRPNLVRAVAQMYYYNDSNG